MQTEETRVLIKTYYDTLPIGNTIMSIAGSTTAATEKSPRLKNTPTRIKRRAL